MRYSNIIILKTDFSCGKIMLVMIRSIKSVCLQRFCLRLLRHRMPMVIMKKPRHCVQKCRNLNVTKHYFKSKKSRKLYHRRHETSFKFPHCNQTNSFHENSNKNTTKTWKSSIEFETCQNVISNFTKKTYKMLNCN